MKVKAKIKFRDIKTNAIINIGDVVDFDDKRAESVIKRGLAEEFKTEKKEGKPNKSKKEKK